MATYFTDFSEYTTDSPPSDWTMRWRGDAAWTVREVAGATGGKVNRYVGLVSGDHNFSSWDAIDSDPNRDDVEMVARFRLLSPDTDQEINLSARASGTTSSKTCYDGGIRARDNDLIWASKFDNNSYDLIDSVAGSFANDTWYWLRTQMVGSAMRVRFWVDGDPEPGTWDIDTTDTSITVAGWVGFRTFWDGALEVDLFGVGTNGDTAPKSGSADIERTLTDIVVTEDESFNSRNLTRDILEDVIVEDVLTKIKQIFLSDSIIADDDLLTIRHGMRHLSEAQSLVLSDSQDVDDFTTAFLTSAVVIAKEGGAASNDSGAFDSGSTGENRVLVVIVVYETGGDPNITGMTYNGTALTKEVEETVAPADNFSETEEIWILAGPDTGSNTLQLTNSATSQDFVVMAAVYTGRDQTDPVISANTVTITNELSNDGTLSMTKPSEDDVIFWALTQDRNTDTVWEPVADNTARTQQGLGGSTNGLNSVIGDMLTGSGSVTAGANQTGNKAEGPHDLVGIGIVLRAVSAAADITRNLTDSVVVNDEISKIKQILLIEGIVVSDEMISSRNLNIYLIDSLFVKDNILSSRNLMRGFVETIDINDAISKIREVFLIEDIGIQDASFIIRHGVRHLEEPESLIVNDEERVARNIVRVLLETIFVLDSILDQGAAILKVLKDSVLLDDDSLRISTIFRSLSDAIDVLDRLSLDKILRKNLTDSIVVDDATKTERSLTRVLAEAIEAQDAILSARSLSRTFSDSIETQDALTAAFSVAIIMEDQVDLADNVVVKISLIRELLDGVSVEDEEFDYYSLTRVMLDSLLTGDDLSSELVFQKLELGSGVITGLDKEDIVSSIEYGEPILSTLETV